MPHAIVLHQAGGPEQLRWESVTVPEPGAGEARVRQTAIGVNFIDVYQRTGLYPLALPAVLGQEGAGVVEAVGPGVTEARVGDRVAYAGVVGAYAEVLNVPSARLVKLPAHIADEVAAAIMLKGMTAEYLVRRTHAVHAGETIVFHAAAGGVGLLACQWAKALGATVIGVVGTPGKVEVARRHGCDHVLVMGPDLPARVRELTAGEGAAVVYDSVGRDTFAASLDCLRPRGLLVSFGNASGPVPAFEPLILMAKGSLFLTRPSLVHYTGTRVDLVASADALFDAIGSGAIRVEPPRRRPLAEAAAAHAELEGRRTTGATVLVP
jgi:NADPH2:quinone reductase